jgi:hypothetical protein
MPTSAGGGRWGHYQHADRHHGYGHHDYGVILGALGAGVLIYTAGRIHGARSSASS